MEEFIEWLQDEHGFEGVDAEDLQAEYSAHELDKLYYEYLDASGKAFV